MNLIGQLFSDWVGLLSLVTIVVAIGVIVYIAVYVLRHAKG